MRVIGATFVLMCLFIAADTTGQVLSDSDSAAVGYGSYRYFDEPVDPDRYLVRPGDQLVVTFIKARLAPLKLTVDSEGNIVDPTLGVMNLSGATLSQAKETLTDIVQDLFKAEQTAISISGPARVSMAVTGAVASPGLYSVFTSQRVSEVIDSAGGLTSGASHRFIVLSGGPQEIPVDLDRADFLGDYSANPCLYAGYRVHVPARSQATVHVAGEVNNPREIELCDGDDLNLLLSLAGNVRSGADTTAIRIIRLNGVEIDSPQDIRDGDVILVPAQPASEDSRRLSVFGAVAIPGCYKYQANLTIVDLVDRAGGFTSAANSARTTVFRKIAADEWGRTTDARYALSVSDGSPRSLNSLPLQPADSIFVPLMMGYVKVTGEIAVPGLLPFRKDADARYYIEAAGGFLPSADSDRIRIFNRISRLTMTASPAVLVHDGDRVIVDIREELK
ncbi:MAG: SLBB domain-containing protein [bacterium]